MEIKVDLGDINRIVKSAGADPNGSVQMFLTNTINRRIGKYMPHKTGFLETKAKRITAPDTIEVVAPNAMYDYYGKVMIDPAINAAGFLTKDGQWRSRRGAVKVLTNRNLNFDTTFNPLAGPFWDRRMMAAEGKQIAQEVTVYAGKSNRP